MREIDRPFYLKIPTSSFLSSEKHVEYLRSLLRHEIIQILKLKERVITM